MDIKEIQNLIKFVAKSGVNEVAIEQGEFKITIKTEIAGVGEHIYVQQPMIQQAAPVAQPVVQAAAPVTEAAPVEKPAEASNLIEIKSPMIGTFYRRSSPDKEAFVNVGDSIGQGDVICIIEAMKLFNEIESEISGKVVKVLVDDNSPIEYDQPLFLIEPA
jgi:acetyl-CoA carboxylase biotin carboxyl carrier protein